MKMSKYGDRHFWYSNYFWNGEEWEEDEKEVSYFWDFNFKNDWILLLLVSVLVLVGVVAFIVNK